MVLSDLKKPIGSAVLFERDGCFVNHSAFNVLTTTFSSTGDLFCFCHLFSLMGGMVIFTEL
jgi:hypothetical protein